ncbi:MAG: hypothetical protein F6K63_01485 [Moorea sp. SIO1G6]|uniref:hypothetical protein n=1 Tax=unclassified Moorena TaxID=2683338 RepID=UPI0013B7F894|nr:MULTISPECIES: hypothetical protein [unclassified Moorena]NEQ12060.1 hypothetical protein [Moorena sp. SIO4E2]NES84254.1 hypothetical protein [Moorena sp. SIO2B7]NET63140.1 hypothetical protein [Moorena sp. SIO1G6]
MWNPSQVDYLEVDPVTQEIFQQYKYALAYIGVDFDREDVQAAVIGCSQGMEPAFQTTISYWIWKQNNYEKFEYPSAFLIKALNQQWTPKSWSNEYLDNPKFKSPCQLWWEKAAEKLGKDVRNSLIADVAEKESGYQYILLMSGQTISLEIVNNWSWEKFYEYAIESKRQEEERIKRL